MARRHRYRRTRRNPKPWQWGLIGLGAVAVGGLSYAGYRVIEERRRKKAIADLPPPPEEPFRPIPPIPPIDDELGAGPCGTDYPGFVPDDDGDGCEPGPSTPAGIYVAEACSDFVFVEGESGTQLAWLSAAIDRAIARSKNAAARSADPTNIATRYFTRFWGDCTWPPPTDATARIANLYMALSYVIGREIISGGGRVLGTSDPDVVDEQLAERLGELGLADFDPSVVPEIRLPSAEPGPAVPPMGPALPGQITPVGP